MRRRRSSAMPPANLTGTILLGGRGGEGGAPPTEFDVIYECCPLVSTVFLFTRLLETICGKRRKLAVVRRRENRRTTAFREWKPPEKEKGESLWIGKLRKRKNKENNEGGGGSKRTKHKGGRKDVYTNAKYKRNEEDK